MPSADEFREELYRAMREALEEEKKYLEIEAGELHYKLGGYPGPHHRIPICCQVMKEEVLSEVGDVVLYDPPSGQGARLRIRYSLPRQETL